MEIHRPSKEICVYIGGEPFSYEFSAVECGGLLVLFDDVGDLAGVVEGLSASELKAWAKADWGRLKEFLAKAFGVKMLRIEEVEVKELGVKC